MDLLASKFNVEGSVLLPNLLSASEVVDMLAWVTDVASWAPEASVGLGYTLHYEHIEGLRHLCRVENFTPLHGGLAAIAERGAAVASEALGRKVILFKEKINIKPPGGRGYGAHYDGPSAAAMGFSAQHFVTVQIAVDAQTMANGCLQLCAGRKNWPAAPVLVPPQNGDPDAGGRVGAIPDDVAEALDFTPVECAPGDALVFDHWAPHQSGPNRSDSQRRTLYFIYSAADEGDCHAEYYAQMAALRADWAKGKEEIEKIRLLGSAR